MDRISEEYWTTQRIDLSDWFQRNAPSLGELYKAALMMIYDGNFPGRTRFIAHAVREIRNRLPDVICGVKRGRVEYVNRLDELWRQWIKSGLNLDDPDSQPTTSARQVPEKYVSVPFPLFRKVSDLVREHVEKRETQRQKAARLFEAISPGDQDLLDYLRPVIFQWLEVTDWFVGKAHDSGVQDNVTDEKELNERFELFEMSLGTLLRGFFKTIEGLDEVLEDANC